MTASLTLAELATLFPDEVRLHGKGDACIAALMHPRKASTAAHLVFAPSVEALAALREGGPVAALVGEETPLSEALLANSAFSFLIAKRPRVMLGKLLQRFETPAWLPALPSTGVHPTAVVDETAVLGEGVQVGPFAVVGAFTSIGAGSVLQAHVVVGAYASLGEGCLLHAGAKVADRCELGHRVILQPNAVVGSDGFSFVTQAAARHENTGATDTEALSRQPLVRIPSVGNVVLGDDVEVGACTTIDRGTLAETRIAADTKLDNLVQVGHNNRIGQGCLIVSQVGIAGSCTIGNGVVIAGQVGMADHLSIGDDAILMAKAGVMHDVAAGDTVIGAPAYSKRKAFQIMKSQEKLPELLSDYKKLRKQVDAALALLSPQEN